MFLLSEHILCEESIVIVKKFDFEILTYLYVLRSPEFMYTIFAVMYVCVYVCMWVNPIASERCVWLSSNSVCMLQVTVGRTLLIFVNIGWIVFLQEYKKEFLYITAKKWNYKNYDSVQTVLSIELKYDIYIIDHRSSYYINFGTSKKCNCL